MSVPYPPESNRPAGSSGAELVSSFSVNLRPALSWFLTFCQVTRWTKLQPLRVAFNPTKTKHLVLILAALRPSLTDDATEPPFSSSEQVETKSESQLARTRCSACACVCVEVRDGRKKTLKCRFGNSPCEDWEDGLRGWMEVKHFICGFCPLWLLATPPDWSKTRTFWGWGSFVIGRLELPGWPHEVSTSCHKLQT